MVLSIIFWVDNRDHPLTKTGKKPRPFSAVSPLVARVYVEKNISLFFGFSLSLPLTSADNTYIMGAC